MSNVIDLGSWLKSRKGRSAGKVPGKPGKGMQGRDAARILDSDNLQFFLNGEEFPAIRFLIEGKGYELCNDGDLYEIDADDV